MAKIIGNTTATPMAVPDWEQKNPRMADYIKNKPDFDGLSEQVDSNKEAIDSLENVVAEKADIDLITVEDIDLICGNVIVETTTTNITLTDISTDEKYTLYIENGKLTMEASEV